MTTQQMIDTLNSIKAGTRLTYAQYPGVTFKVTYVNKQGGKLNRIDVGLLEEGKEESRWVPGRFLAAGTMVELDNRKHTTWYARKGDLGSFQIID